jgi:hypothetical protein
MRRIKVILAVLAMLVMVAASAVPAMANPTWNDCGDNSCTNNDWNTCRGTVTTVIGTTIGGAPGGGNNPAGGTRMSAGRISS